MLHWSVLLLRKHSRSWLYRHALKTPRYSNKYTWILVKVLSIILIELLIYLCACVCVFVYIRESTKSLREHQKAAVPEVPAMGSCLSKSQMPSTSVDLPTATCALIRFLQPSSRRGFLCCILTDFIHHKFYSFSRVLIPNQMLL